jgi:hypothetical protein
VSSIETGANVFHDTIESHIPIGDGIASLEHGVVSFVNDGAWRTPPLFRRFLVGAHVDSRVDTMRRRLGPDRA